MSLLWTECTDPWDPYQYVRVGPVRFYVTKARPFGFRRWLLEGFVGTVHRYKYFRSEEAAKAAAEEWLA